MKTIKPLLFLAFITAILIGCSQSQATEVQTPQTITTKLLLYKCDTMKGKNWLLGEYLDCPPHLWLTIPLKADGKTPDMTISNTYPNHKDIFIWNNNMLQLNPVYFEKGAEITYIIIKNKGELDTHILKKIIISPGMKADPHPKNFQNLW